MCASERTPDAAATLPMLGWTYAGCRWLGCHKLQRFPELMCQGQSPLAKTQTHTHTHDAAWCGLPGINLLQISGDVTLSMCAEECTQNTNTNNYAYTHTLEHRTVGCLSRSVCISSKASSFQSCGLIHPSSSIQSEKERAGRRRRTRWKVSDERGGRDRLARGYLDKWATAAA